MVVWYHFCYSFYSYRYSPFVWCRSHMWTS